MKALLVIGIIGLTVIALFGCGSSSKGLQSASEGDVPEWFTNAPQDSNYLFAATTATSQDLQLAVDKATTAARTEIGRQVEVKVAGLQERFDEETGIGQDAQLLQQMTQASKTVTSTSLSGSRIKNQTQAKDGNIWRAYVLVEYPIGAANEALMKAIQDNNELHTKLRASETFKELDEEVKKYEESKKK